MCKYLIKNWKTDAYVYKWFSNKYEENLTFEEI